MFDKKSDVDRHVESCLKKINSEKEVRFRCHDSPCPGMRKFKNLLVYTFVCFTQQIVDFSISHYNKFYYHILI